MALPHTESTLTHRAVPQWVFWVYLGTYLAAVTTLISYAVLSGSKRYDISGTSFPGLVSSISEIVGYFTATAATALVTGGLVYIVTTASPDDTGVLDAGSFRLHLLVERLTLVWLFSAAAMVVIQAANDAGLSVFRVIRTAALTDAIGASEISRGWIIATIAAACVTVGLRLTVRWVTHVLLLIPAIIGVIAVPVTGNAGQGPHHDYTTSTMIVFSVALAIMVAMTWCPAMAPPHGQLHRRVRIIQLVAGGVTISYGALLLALMLTADTAVNSVYGRASIIAAVAVSSVWLYQILSPRISAHLSPTAQAMMNIITTSATVVAMMAALAAISVLAVNTSPRLLGEPFTAWDVFLGYQLPDPPSALRLLTLWRFDTFMGIAAIALAGLYSAGVIRLRRRGDTWPPGRFAAWLLGCALVVFVTGSGIRAYGSAMFSVHMAEHMALNMFIPIFLVLGCPVTLALRALPSAKRDQPPGPREWLLWLIHSPATKFISHPITAFILFVTSLYIVYLTPVFDTLVRYHWGHEFMGVHFLLTGYLFFWGIIGSDPGPRRLPFPGRLGLLFAVMPFHAFFGIATMTMTSAIGETFYRYVNLPWLSSINDDQQLGGAITWGSSELPVVVVVIALVTQWARYDRRAATRTDRHTHANYGDDEFDAYNAMLAELAATRSHQGSDQKTPKL